MSAILVKMPPAMRSAAAPERLADGEAEEAGAGDLAGHEQQDDEHDEQLDRDQQHADAHAGAQRDVADRPGLAAEAGERGAGVGEVLTRMPNQATP